MSGGAFDYGCYSVSRFADELDCKIRENNEPHEDDYCENFDSDTIKRLEEAMLYIRKAGKIAKEVEWLYSGDIGEKSFLDAIDKILP